MYYITISNGLLEGDHQEKMGSCVWQFMWCIDKVTSINEEGEGKVLGGKPINLTDIHGCSERTNSRNLNKLEKLGYIKLIHTPYGISIRVNKAKKVFQKREDNIGVPKRSDIIGVPLTKFGVPNKIIQLDNTAKTLSEQSSRGKTKKGKEFSVIENSIYTAFKESVNENIYSSVANWKIEREACKILNNNYGLQIVLSVIRNVLPKTNLLPGMPQIYTPAKLLEKWAQLSQAKDRKINEVKKQQDKLGKVYL